MQSQTPVFCPVLNQSKFPFLSPCPDLMAALLLPFTSVTHIWWSVRKLSIKIESVQHSSMETRQVSPVPRLCERHSGNWQVSEFHLWVISAQPLEVMSDCAPLGSAQEAWRGTIKNWVISNWQVLLKPHGQTVQPLSYKQVRKYLWYIIWYILYSDACVCMKRTSKA